MFYKIFYYILFSCTQKEVVRKIFSVNVLTLIMLHRNLGITKDEQKCSVKKVLLEISQNSQESTCVRVSFLIKLQA